MVSTPLFSLLRVYKCEQKRNVVTKHTAAAAVASGAAGWRAINKLNCSCSVQTHARSSR